MARSRARWGLGGVIVIGVSALVVGGCIHQAGAKPVETDSGEPAHRVECWTDRQECLDAADETCPGGYRLIDSKQQRVPYGSGSGSRELYTMTIQCN